MKISVAKLVFLSFLVFLFSTCSQKNYLEITQTNFKEEVSPQSNLKFTFNQSLVGDTLLGVWDTTAYLQFTPRVAGKFKWVSPSEVIFSPEKGFEASTDYQAVINAAAFVNKDKKPNTDPSKIINFHTTYLQVESTEAFWAIDERMTNQLRINLNFNYAVNPNGLQALVSAMVGEQAITAIRVLNQSPSKVIELLIEESNRSNLEEKELQINLAAGIQCEESNFVSKQPITQTLTTPSKKALRIEQVLTEYENFQPQILVRTNQSVSLVNVLNHINISPKMVFEVAPRENGFVIKGNFLKGKAYTLLIDKKMQGVFGAGLEQDLRQEIVFGESRPIISFLNKEAHYLSSKGSKNIGIRINNVEKVRVTIYKIFENNLVHHLRENSYFYDNASSYKSRYYNYGEVIFEEIYESKTLPMVSDFRVLNLDFDKLKSQSGVFVIKVSSTEELWKNSSAMVSISDIGFIARETTEDVYVFANSLLDAKPLNGLKVSLISETNQVIASANTDKEGVVVFEGIKKKHPDKNLQLITAQSNDDFNYLYLSRSTVNQNGFDTDGYYDRKGGYMAFIYGERTLYRPGESINLNVVVRSKGWKPAAKMPILLKLKLPNGKDLVSMRGTLDAQGAFSTSIALSASAITGTYLAEVYSVTEQYLASESISVEEFMPNRIKVALNLLEKDFKTLKKENFQLNDSIRVQLNAVNLFGPPAANRNYDLMFSLSRVTFQPKAYPQYSFGLKSERDNEGYLAEENLEYKNTEGLTDAEGKAYHSFLLSNEYRNLGLLKGNLYATVYDETGRPVSRSINFDVFSQNTFVGLQTDEGYVGTGRNATFNLIAISKNETLTSTKATVSVIRYKWQTVLERDYSMNYRYVSRKQAELVKEEEIQVNQQMAYNFTPQISGDYEIRVKQTGTQTFVAKQFYAYGYDYTSGNSFQVNKDGKVEIKLDKPSYQVGEQAKVLFTTPFNGRLLVTVEQDKVFKHFYLDTKNKSASATLDLTNEHLPNVYITATLIKPVSDGAIPLAVAHGFQPIKVENKTTKLDLSIIAVEKTESNQKQTITVRTQQPQAGVQITLAVVDEGILQIKNYQNPNPHGYFYQKRALEVGAFDLYPMLFPEINLGKLATGGGYAALEGRNNPMVNKRVKLVSFWSGILQTNAAGEASYTIDIPQFSGSLRIMAVAYKEGAFGAAAKNMVVADPLVVSTGLPLFLAPKDKVKVPVTLSNTTNQSTTAQVQLKTSNALKVISENTFSVPIPANQEAQVEFEIEAGQVMDSAKVEVIAQALGRTFSEKLDINIRPISGFTKQAGSGQIAAGNSTNLNLKTELLPSSVKSKLTVSNSPLVQFTNNLEYLLEYPHGCVEQVTSSVFPQLYVQELIKAVSPNPKNTDLYEAQIRENVQEGIMQLLAVQTYSGGLSYWQSGYDMHWFGTAYAAHFMLEAQKQGYSVPQTALDWMFLYMRREIDNRNTEEYFFKDDEGKRRKKHIAPKEAIYSLYVLALAKQPAVSLMNYYKENQQLLALDSKYLLAASYLVLGDKATYQNLLPKAFEGERSEQVLSGSFHSAMRDEALALNALLEGDPTNPQVAEMAKSLSEQLKSNTSLNTQENAMALLALGKLAKLNESNQVTGQIALNGASIGTYNGKLLILTQNLANAQLNLSAQGQGNLYYFWQMQGFNPSGKIKEEDNKLKVRKTFYDVEGKQIKNLVFRQNDLVIVKISIAAEPYFRNLENVVITDMLPAGLEIENPRLSEAREFAWLKPKDYPLHFDIRDDRINYFATAKGTVQEFYYLARAVSKGTFQMGPVSADAMYSGDYYSYSGSGTVTVIDRVERRN